MFVPCGFVRNAGVVFVMDCVMLSDVLLCVFLCLCVCLMCVCVAVCFVVFCCLCAVLSKRLCLNDVCVNLL